MGDRSPPSPPQVLQPHKTLLSFFSLHGGRGYSVGGLVFLFGHSYPSDHIVPLSPQMFSLFHYLSVLIYLPAFPFQIILSLIVFQTALFLSRPYTQDSPSDGNP